MQPSPANGVGFRGLEGWPKALELGKCIREGASGPRRVHWGSSRPLGRELRRSRVLGQGIYILRGGGSSLSPLPSEKTLSLEVCGDRKTPQEPVGWPSGLTLQTQPPVTPGTGNRVGTLASPCGRGRAVGRVRYRGSSAGQCSPSW